MHREEAYRTMRLLASDHPDEAMRAITDGLNDRLEKERERTNAYMRAFMGSLVLADSKRMTSDLKQQIANVVIDAMENGARSAFSSEYEKEFIARWKVVPIDEDADQ